MAQHATIFLSYSEHATEKLSHMIFFIGRPPLHTLQALAGGALLCAVVDPAMAATLCQCCPFSGDGQMIQSLSLKSVVITIVVMYVCSRRLVGSTNQACSSGFYFKIV